MSALTSQDIIDHLWRLGHFHNPNMPTSLGAMKPENGKQRLTGLTLASSDVKTAVASFQDFMRADLMRIYAAEKGHTNVAIDGEVGPLTAKLFDVQRCACPDYAMEGAVVEGAATGRWPSGCDPEHPDVHVIRVWVDKKGEIQGGSPGTFGDKSVPMPAWWEPLFESRIWPLIEQTFLNVGVYLKRVNAWQELKGGLSFAWKIPPGNGSSTIGLAVVPGGPLSCGTIFWLRINHVWRPTDVIDDLVTYYLRTIVHEFLHNLGLGHNSNPASVLYPSVQFLPFDARSLLADPILPLYKQWYPGTPIVIGKPPVDPPPITPPTPIGFDSDKAVFIYGGKQYLLKERVTS